MPAENLITKKMIYAVDYEPVFSLLDSRGRLLGTLKNSNLFEFVGFNTNGIDARDTRNNKIITFSMTTNRFAGLIEADNLNLNDYNAYLHLCTQLMNDLNITTLKRVGVRFFILNEVESFNIANNLFVSKLDANIRNLIGANYIDSAIVPVVEEEGNKIRIAMGPLKPEEYPRYFELHHRIDIPAALFYDCDFFVTTYQYRTFRLERFVNDGYEIIINKISRLNHSLIQELNLNQNRND